MLTMMSDQTLKLNLGNSKLREGTPSNQASTKNQGHKMNLAKTTYNESSNQHFKNNLLSTKNSKSNNQYSRAPFG
jgi:hypothetical protein